MLASIPLITEKRCNHRRNEVKDCMNVITTVRRKLRTSSSLLVSAICARLCRSVMQQLSSPSEKLDAKRSTTSFRYSRYQELIDRFIACDPQRMIEIGVWKGDRAVEFLTRGTRLAEYVGFDLFEDITAELFVREGMGRCFTQTMHDVRGRLLGIRRRETDVRLIKGNTTQTLPDFVASCKHRYDFIFIDGGHSLDTIDNDWKYASLLLAPDGVCVFDDYYLEDDSMGCKHLVDNLDTSKWEKDFFRGIEKTVEGHYITMAVITPRISNSAIEIPVASVDRV